MELEQVAFKQMMDNAKKRINFIHNSLIETNTKVKFPIELFNNYFAPYFFGQIPINEQSDIFSTWIGIAGSPTSEVDIVDTLGNIVFTVPPLYNTDVIDILRKNSELSKVVDNYNNYGNALPAVAMGFVKNNLLPAVTDIIDKDNIADNLTGWAKIAQHYMPTSQPSEQNKSTISNNEDTDLNYDV